MLEACHGDEPRGSDSFAKDAVIMVKFLMPALGLLVLSGCTMFSTAPSAGMTSALPQLSPERAAEVPEGARVEIERRYTSGDWRAVTTGVVLKSSPEGLALANCTVQGTSYHGTPIVSKLPYTGRLFKNTGIGTQQVPVLWLPVNEISAVKVLEPPPAGYVAPKIKIETANTAPRGVDLDAQTPTARGAKRS
jgi:hypothetical protein